MVPFSVLFSMSLSVPVEGLVYRIDCTLSHKNNSLLYVVILYYNIRIEKSTIHCNFILSLIYKSQCHIKYLILYPILYYNSLQIK